MPTPKYTCRAAYGYDEAENSNESTHTKWDPSKTIQSQKDDADINKIVKRMILTGEPPPSREGVYAAFDRNFDFHEAQNQIRAGIEAFASLDADLRAEFQNDPALFHDYVTNPDNIDELRKLGLAAPKAPQSPPAGPAGPEPTVPGKPPGDPQKG